MATVLCILDISYAVYVIYDYEWLHGAGILLKVTYYFRNLNEKYSFGDFPNGAMVYGFILQER
jgi:hypothetical protein